MNQFIKFSLLTSAAAVAGYVALNRNETIVFATKTADKFSEKKQDLANWNRSKKAVTGNLKKLKSSIEEATPLLDELQSDIDKFQYKIQPYLDKIESVTNNLQK